MKGEDDGGRRSRRRVLAPVTVIEPTQPMADRDGVRQKDAVHQVRLTKGWRDYMRFQGGLEDDPPPTPSEEERGDVRGGEEERVKRERRE